MANQVDELIDTLEETQRLNEEAARLRKEAAQSRAEARMWWWIAGGVAVVGTVGISWLRRSKRPGRSRNPSSMDPHNY